MTVALLVIDFINDIAHPEGKIARSAERIKKNQVIEKSNDAIAHARKASHLLIFVKVGFHPGYLDCPKTSPIFGGAAQHNALLLGSWGTEFHKKLNVQRTDLMIVKPRVSAFYSTPLEALLRAQNIQHLVLTGTATNMAVEHTARDAHDRDYSVVVLKDACETASEEGQQASLESMSRFSTIIPTSQYTQSD